MEKMPPYKGKGDRDGGCLPNNNQQPFVNGTLYFNQFLYVMVLLFFWTLLYKGWNISLPHRKGQSFTMTMSPIFQSMMIFASVVFQQFLFLDTGLCQAGGQQLFISKFTFACICMKPFFSIFPAVVCIFYLSHLYSHCYITYPYFCAHISPIVYFCHVISYRPNLICNILVVEVILRLDAY